MGRLAGVGAGVLNLSRLGEFAESYRTGPDAVITIVDRQNRVIWATPGSGRTALEDLSEDILVRRGEAAKSAYQYQPAGQNAAAGPRVVGHAMIDQTGWRVFVEQPLAAMQLQTTRYTSPRWGSLAWRSSARSSGRGGSRGPSARHSKSSSRGFATLGPPAAGPGDHLEPVPGNLDPSPGLQPHAAPADSFLSGARTSAGRARSSSIRNCATLTEDLDLKVRERTAELAQAKRDGGGGQPREERVPGEHEPRDPHADERHHRHDRACARHAAHDRRSASTSRPCVSRPTRCW